MTRIVVQFHQHEDCLHRKHLIHHLVGRWRASGKSVDYTKGDSPVEADLFIHHVALSRVPPGYLQASRGCRRAVNSGAADIRKHVWMQDLLRRNSPHQGPVIVKTTLNYSGWDEVKMGLDPYAESGMRRPLVLHPFFEWMPGHWRIRLSRTAGFSLFRSTRKPYRIFPSLRHVPRAVFRCPGLVVQPYLTELHDGLHCLREWYFLGDASHDTAELSAAPIFTSGTKASGLVAPPPPEVRALRQRLKLDYGKIDYAIVDGRTVIYDVNKTIGTTANSGPSFSQLVEDLAPGIETWLR